MSLLRRGRATSGEERRGEEEVVSFGVVFLYVLFSRGALSGRRDGRRSSERVEKKGSLCMPQKKCLVGVVGDEGGCVGGVAAGASGVLAEVGEGVGLGALEEDGLGFGDVGVVAEPGFEAGLLERAAVGEGQGPGGFGL